MSDEATTHVVLSRAVATAVKAYGIRIKTRKTRSREALAENSFGRTFRIKGFHISIAVDLRVLLQLPVALTYDAKSTRQSLSGPTEITHPCSRV
jgi:hypothetical protein